MPNHGEKSPNFHENSLKFSLASLAHLFLVQIFQKSRKK